MPDLLIIHGGAPTAVMNASLYGVLADARSAPEIRKVWGAAHGTEGLLREDLIDLTDLSDATLEALLRTPASAIGTSRTPLEEKDYAAMADILVRRGIGYVLMNGGNGTMDACGRLHRACAGRGIRVAGIPKTIDNDIAVTDHAPGFGSAARFVARTVADLSEDLKSLPIHVCILEVMGRNAGWLAAASALARRTCGAPPHLIYVPERPFAEADFLRRAEALFHARGSVLVVVSEGLKGPDGGPLVPPIFRAERAEYAGDVSAYLAQLVIQKLGIKARSEKPGILGRCSSLDQSVPDRKDAVEMGCAALEALRAGRSGVMAGFRRTAPDRWENILIPVEQVMLTERTLPDRFLAQGSPDVTQEFLEWCRPLVGDALPDYIDLKPQQLGVNT